MIFRHEVNLAVPVYYFADATVLKSMIRSDPGIMLLRKGYVIGQWHYNDIPTAGRPEDSAKPVQRAGRIKSGRSHPTAASRKSLLLVLPILLSG